MSAEHAIDALTDDERRLMEAIAADLDREMAVEPSADFAARVRARIGAADRDRGWRFPWLLAAAAALTIATGILFATWRAAPETTGAPALRAGHDVALPAESVPDPVVGTNRTPDAGSARALSAKASAASARARTDGPGTGIDRQIASAAEPEVLVPDDLRLAIERVMAMGRAGTLNQQTFRPERTAATAEESPEPVAMVVEELHVPPINPDAGGVEKGFGL
jgi:hypothetical protein